MNDLYSRTIPAQIKSLEGLKFIIRNAQNFLTEAGKTDEELLQSRLAPDMATFIGQVQFATDAVRLSASKLTQTERPSYEDIEQTMDDLVARIEKTVAYLKTITPEQFAGKEEAKIELSFAPGKYLTASDFAQEMGLANFYFHVTIAYALARKLGMPLQKSDYLNGLPFYDI
jgi:hypothetical protein